MKTTQVTSRVVALENPHYRGQSEGGRFRVRTRSKPVEVDSSLFIKTSCMKHPIRINYIVLGHEIDMLSNKYSS